MSYQILNSQTVVAYLKDLEPIQAIFSDFSVLQVEEIGDGNVNYVYRIKDPKTSASVILKQAVPYLRVVGESFPLSRERMNFEIMALETGQQYTPAHVPKIYHSSREQSLVIMEDLAQHKIVRGEMIQGVVFPKFAEHMAHYLADTLFATSDFFMDSEDKKKLQQRFINPDLCKLTEDFVFTHPYEDSETNDYNPKLAQGVIDKVQKDGPVKIAVAQMRYKFMNNAQALLHGDLHIGSIMANQDDTYVIDAEFAFFGPMGFDLGALIGNLYMNYFSHRYQWHLQGQDCIQYRQWLLDTIAQIWTKFATRFRALWLEQEVKSGRKQWLYPGGMEDFNAFIDAYMAELFADTIGFAACKMMRRVVGLAKVADFANIEDLTVRAKIETNIINMASQMIVNRGQINDIQGLNALAIKTNSVEALICGPQQ